jgi:hypothetical protein
MVKRWTAIGLREAVKRLRRRKGHRDLPNPRQTLADRAVIIDRAAEAA